MLRELKALSKVSTLHLRRFAAPFTLQPIATPSDLIAKETIPIKNIQKGAIQRVLLVEVTYKSICPGSY